MNAFLTSLVLLVAISIGAVFALEALDPSAARVFSVDPNVRL